VSILVELSVDFSKIDALIAGINAEKYSVKAPGNALNVLIDLK
jgi:hypothetical protein